MIRKSWAAPALFVAAAAVALQSSTAALAPRLWTGRGLANLSPAHILDYSADPVFAVPLLEAAFVAKLLGSTAEKLASVRPAEAAGNGTAPPASVRPGGGANHNPSPAPRPTPAPAPTSAPATPLLPGTAFIRVSMTASRTVVAAGGELVYTVFAHNDAASPVLATFSITTHVPRFTLQCSDLIGTCVQPGDYDGTSRSPDDPHFNPLPEERVMTLQPKAERVIFTLRVRVVDFAPPNTTLANHAHVEVVGDGQGARTAIAPEVTVQ